MVIYGVIGAGEVECGEDEALGCSVLGLLLGQGAEWKIQTESQHKEWKNMTPKKGHLFQKTKICYKIKG